MTNPDRETTWRLPMADPIREALILARPYLVEASGRSYDGTNGHGIRETAKRRIALIDEAISALSAPPDSPAVGSLPVARLGTTPDGQHPWVADQNVVALGERVWRNGKPHSHDLIRFSDALRDHFYAAAKQAAKPKDSALPVEIPTVDIPIAAGELIAKTYGYDQVVIVARKVGVREHVTTYGVDKSHCDVAARMGHFFKHKLMGWPER